MAYENQNTAVVRSWPCGATTLAAKQYYAVQLTTVSGVEVLSLADATVRAVGILQDTPAPGVAGSVMLMGISRAITDGSSTAIAAMDALAPDANGKLVKTTTDNDEVVAYALEPSTADGQIIAVFVLPMRRY
jgi:hypothetical protein